MRSVCSRPASRHSAAERLRCFFMRKAEWIQIIKRQQERIVTFLAFQYMMKKIGDIKENPSKIFYMYVIKAEWKKTVSYSHGSERKKLIWIIHR